jgi:hypothetical protein
MPNIDVKYDLAMAPGPGKTRVYFSQGDRGLGTATLSLFANNYPLYLEEGITAMIVGRKPDKTAYAYDCQISKDRRAVIVTAAEQMTAVAGTGEAQIIFTDGAGNIAGTCNFEVIVEADPTEGTTPSESDYAVFYQAIAAAGEAQTSAQQAATSATAAQAAAQTATEKAQEATEAAEAAEADQPVIVSLSVTAAAVATAITQSQESGQPVTLAAQYVTADPADASAIRAALGAGKKVRFDLTATTGGDTAIRTSTARCRSVLGGRDITHYYVTFDNADLCGYFADLSLLTIDYTCDANRKNGVAVGVTAVSADEDFELIFTASLEGQPEPPTTVPATANLTQAEVAAAYAAGKKVNAKIRFATGMPITYDLVPVYTATVEMSGTAEYVYNGLLILGTGMYTVVAKWDNGNPMVALTGKIEVTS